MGPPTWAASTLPSPTAMATDTPPSTPATTTARGPLMLSPRLMPTPMSSTAASAMPATTATDSATPAMATATPLSTAASTTARGPLTPSPRLTPTTATTATPAPTDTPTTAKCTSMDLRSSTGRRDLPTQQYSKKCDEPTITRSKLPKKRPAPCALSLSQSTKLPLAETVLMMSARKKQNTE